MLDRREMMKRAGMAALAAGFGSAKAFALDTVTLPFDNGERPLVKYPQKRPMIGLTSRPLSYGAAHTGGPAHFAFAVPRAAIAAEKARLESLGIEVEGPVTFESWKADSIYFSDPDDHRVELCGFEHLDLDDTGRRV